MIPNSAGVAFSLRSGATHLQCMCIVIYSDDGISWEMKGVCSVCPLNESRGNQFCTTTLEIKCHGGNEITINFFTRTEMKSPPWYMSEHSLEICRPTYSYIHSIGVGGMVVDEGTANGSRADFIVKGGIYV